MTGVAQNDQSGNGGGILNCSKCEAPNDNAAKFCNSCGTALSADIVSQLGNAEFPAAPMPQKKRGGCLKPLLIIVGIILGIFILIGIFASDDESPQEQGSSPGITEGGKGSPTANSTKASINLEQFQAEAASYPYKELARNPKEHMDKKVVYRGEVIQVMESGNNIVYRINVTKSEFGYDDTVYVTYKRGKDEPRILEDDIVTFWGESKGLKSYQSTLGGQITIPQVNAVAIELYR
ncbi:MAG: zinc ribbon domain-containing protein [Cohnella sp.]|nr:zinc ribbon domain-containing protein [Cohnella sp.]